MNREVAGAMNQICACGMAKVLSARAVQPGKIQSRFGQDVGRNVRIGKAAAGAGIERNKFKIHSRRNRHHHWLEFCLCSQPHLAAGEIGCHVGRCRQRKSCPRAPRAAQGSRTAGSIPHSSGAGPVGVCAGSKVCSGSGTIPVGHLPLDLARSIRRKSLRRSGLVGVTRGGHGHTPLWSGLPILPSPDGRVCDLNHGGR